MLVIGFLTLGEVLVLQSPPTEDDESVRVVLRSRYAPQVSCRHKLAYQYACTALYPLTAIIRESQVLLVEFDGVTEDAAYRTRSNDVVVKALFFQGIILRKARLVYEVHGFLDGVVDVLVIWGQREEEVVEHLNMALGFHLKRFVHSSLLYEDGHSAV